ncbi:MAG: PHP domain-containing protein [Methanospirillaceae archaeon]|nr:PHP domain-containing protein [Methanospirillaceae archaeon]
MLACDLHVHSSHSRDGESSITDIIREAERRGLFGIAITDHDTMSGVTEALAIETPLMIIPGIEISTRQGHLLALGIKEPVAPGQDIFSTVTEIRECGGISVLPHPFHRYRHGAGLIIPEVIAVVDAVEVYNSRYIIGTANRQAVKAAGRYHKPMVGGSDAHRASYVGYGLTYIDAKPDLLSILTAIRDGKTEYGGRKTPLMVYTGQSARNSWNRIKRRISR